MTIWFENLVTGQRWEISHADLIARLSKDSEYRQIEDPTIPKSDPRPKKARKT